ncbi:ATP-binding cassette domain-containing protein [Gleimia hominis]|uniref:ATP-binding cassette domain-containing protein n=1 Tax=Gleimia hominis TaxID=595468 RepID=UPI000C8097B6|nr:ATP-binding cassette domain-containing protein [Gleimia hominis]WIK64356.1 ATP-binding cassette domain-containing protein [Gleimia hominis]
MRAKHGATQPLIELKHVGKRYGENWVFTDVSFTIPKRGVVALVGDSGVGKTTLSRIALKLTAPTRGKVYHAHELTVSALFAEDRLLPTRTIEQNLQYVGVDPRAAFPVASELGIDQVMGSYPGELSTGMARRGALLRSLMVPSDVILLDEPFKGIDSRQRDLIAPCIARERERRAVLLIDHDTDRVGALADNIVNLT